MSIVCHGLRLLRQTLKMSRHSIAVEYELLTRSSGAGGGSEGEVILLGLPSGEGGARRG